MAFVEGAALALVVVLAWTWLRPGRPGRRGRVLGVAIWAVLAAASVWLSLTMLGPRGEVPANRPIEDPREGYLTSDACRSCHPDQYDSWHDSYHRTMTQVASPEAVVPAFDEVTTDAFGRRYRLFWRDDELWCEMDDPTWREVLIPAPRVALPIVLTTGSHHLQVYWYATQTGRLIGMLPVAYDIHDARWFPVDTNFIQPPTDPHLRKPMQVGQWNQRCIACHTTRPEPRLAGPAGEWDSRATELGIACEACHGPGERHVEANQNPLRRYWHHLTGRTDDTIVNPARVPHDRSSDVCARCHSVWNFPSNELLKEFRTAGDRFVPGEVLAEAGISVSHGRETNPDSFWPDGAVRAQGREFSAMSRSGCFTRGELSCVSCHTMHQTPDDPRPVREWANDQLTPGAGGDDACRPCHEKYWDDIKAHTFHEVASSGSRCQNCHMPHTALGARKASRNHEIDSPRVATELASGRPNACNLCHLDRTLEWTNEYLVRWYEHERVELEPVHHTVPGVLVHLLRGDAARRAIALWNLTWPEAVAASRADEWSPPFLAQLLVDPYHAVRYIAQRSLEKHPLFPDLDYDYLGADDHRYRVMDEVIARWSRWREASGGSAALDAVLEPPDGREHAGGDGKSPRATGDGASGDGASSDSASSDGATGDAALGDGAAGATPVSAADAVRARESGDARRLRDVAIFEELLRNRDDSPIRINE